MVDSGTSLEEIDLVLRHGMFSLDFEGFTVSLGDSQSDNPTVVTVLGNHVSQVDSLQDITGGDSVVISFVCKGQRQHTLLLQVGFVDSGKGLDKDHLTTKELWR
ncbi:hypothetical protein WICPIJ_002263 [Wickerhamomyces pijperi]|uniref:Uncharacterized protein n=1 Tax=Wickerhamomyces pijperi TaxID=599730 RepID=A0A9P8QC97_WICPI|nr:hypothetical protein WICPIJ_002263 [Wickerhamomyces pijperi]